MIHKLAFAGLHRRWPDYLVLFSGLSIGAAIFFICLQHWPLTKSF